MLTAGAASMAVIALIFLTLGWFAPVLVVALVIGGIVMFHWIVWGWWLQKILRQAEEDEDAADDQ